MKKEGIGKTKEKILQEEKYSKKLMLIDEKWDKIYALQQKKEWNKANLLIAKLWHKYKYKYKITEGP